MRHNHLRDLPRAGKPSLGTHVISPWSAIYELVGRSGAFDYVEFVAEEAPFDLHDLDGIGRAVELFPGMGAMIKVDADLRIIESAQAAGVQPRAETKRPEQSRFYLDRGVRHFSIGTDLGILANWLRTEGGTLRAELARLS